MKLKKLTVAICMGLVMSILMSFAGFDASCLELKDNLLRLHIVANSNNENDQALKLKVRDKLLEVGDEAFKDTENLILAKETANEMLPVFKAAASEVIKQEGYNYSVNVTLGKAFFDTRVYDSFTLPAGEYDALKVVIGEGEGKNWWCVIFPSVCIPSASNKELGSVISNNTEKIANNAPKYKIKFKVIEWFETIKNGLYK